MSRIDELDEETRGQIDSLLRANVPQAQIRERLRPLLEAKGEAPLSAGGLNRYATRLEPVAARLRDTQVFVAALRSELGEQGWSTETGQILIQLLQSLAFEVAQHLEGGPEASPETVRTLKDIGLLVMRLERSAQIGAEREHRITSRVASRGKEAARRLGLSEATADELFDAMTRVPPEAA